MPKPSHSGSSSNEPALGSSGGSGCNWESAYLNHFRHHGFMETEEELEAVYSEAAVGTEAVYCEDCEFWLNGPTTLEDHKKGKNHKKTIQLSRRRQSQCSMPQRMASFPPDRYTQRYNAQGLPKVFRNISAPPVCAVRKPRIQPPRPEPEPLSSLARRP